MGLGDDEGVDIGVSPPRAGGGGTLVSAPLRGAARSALVLPAQRISIPGAPPPKVRILQLFGQQPGSSEPHTGRPPHKEEEQQQTRARLYRPTRPTAACPNPGRDGLHKSKRVIAYSPEPKGERVD